ncbi:MFS transporter [Sphingomonas sp. 1P06PA]|uniref:MFS transporter n=1 Tax=Sphingomonas sp. 1P06PA TaxID=554121 RepID=UPI0039A57F95
MDTSIDPRATPRSLKALDALNLFLADVRDGLGPYLAIYLLAVRGPSHGWTELTIGYVMTIAGIVGLAAQTPAGSLIDRSSAKRLILAVATMAITISCLALPFVSGFAIVTITQSIAAIAGAVIAPALAGLTLGLVGRRAFARRIGRNEAFNHAGNAASAAAAGLLAWWFGPVVVFVLMAVLALASLAAVLAIREQDIDHVVARGLDHHTEGDDQPVGWAALFKDRRLLTFAVLAALFHLANAAMLPSTGQLLSKILGPAQATSLIAMCIVAAQLVMVPVAIVVGRNVDRWGRKPLFLTAFGVLAARGALYPLSDAPAWLLAVQCLDGVGAGIFGALLPVVIADITRGSGRFNAALGAVSTVQGLGGALSASLAGAVIVAGGYSTSFLTLAAIAALGFVGYALLMPETRTRDA